MKRLASAMLLLATAPACTHAAEAPAPSISDLRVAYESGRTTAEKQVAAMLERIARDEPRLNAFTTMNPDALEEARAIDRRRAAGEPLGPLAGIPVIVKESLDVAGLPSTGGWGPLRDVGGKGPLVPASDASAVSRLRSAGAIILGKGNIPALSLGASDADNSWAGPTCNALMPDRLPGGSSAGVAAAVARGLAVAGVAAETGGSIQNPAAAQGLVGIKPSFGLVPNDGLMPLSTSVLDVVGVHARSVTDAAIMLDAIAGASPADPKTRSAQGRLPPGGYAATLAVDGLRGLRIGGYGPGWSGQPLTPPVALLYDRALARTEAAGAVRVSDPFAGSGFAALMADHALKPYLYGLETLPFDFDRYLRRGGFGPADSLASLIAAGADPFADPALLLGKIWKLLALRDAGTPSIYSRPWAELDARSEAMPLPPVDAQMPDLAPFMALQEHYARMFESVMDRQRVDMLLFPQAFDELPRRGGQAVFPVVASPQINLLGLPAVVLPAGRHASGAPFAVILIGRKWSEARLLGAALALERQFAGQGGEGSLPRRAESGEAARVGCAVGSERSPE